VRFSPQLPYIYLPESLYNKAVDQIEAIYGSKICDRDNNICKIEKKCSEVPRTNDFHISFDLKDDISSYTFELDYDAFFNSGFFFGDATGSSCHVAIFKHNAEDMNTVDYDLVLIGNIFMKKYYVVYDMSPLEKGKDYIQVGVGLQNDEFLAGT